MAGYDTAIAAFLDDIETNLTGFPIVWPNEAFDPANPIGRFAAFPANGKHALLSIETMDAAQEAHGTATGARSVRGEFQFECRAAKGKGPAEAMGAAATIGDYLRAKSLASGELRCLEPVLEELGEDAGWYSWRCRVPFLHLTGAP